MTFNASEHLTVRNLPAKLEGLVQRWGDEKREFYLGPENMFFFSAFQMNYQNGKDIPTEMGSWVAHTRNCPIPKRMSCDEIDELQYELFKDHIPQQADLVIGFKCNLSCSMCPYHGPDNQTFASRFAQQTQELPTATVLARLDKLAALGCNHVNIGPFGEYFLRRDWEEIWSYACDLFPKVSTVSNGTLLDQKKLDAFLRYGEKIKTLKISLNALTSETWCRVSGVKNRQLFDTAMKAMEILIDNHVPVVASMVVTAENHHELEGFVKYWGERQVDVVVNRMVSGQEFFSGDPAVDNSGWPYYSCEAVNGPVMFVLSNGIMAPCCRGTYCYDDANSYSLPIISLDESVEAIRIKWREALKNKVFKEICRTCTLFSVSSDGKSSQVLAYGYKSNVNSVGFQIKGRRKKKKSVAERVAAEMNRVKRRIKNKLST